MPKMETMPCSAYRNADGIDDKAILAES